MKKNNLQIFNSNLNNKFKLISLETKLNDKGKVKYLPPVSKEWKNTVYSYYKNNMKNIPVNNINANKIIKIYFSLYLKDNLKVYKILDDRKPSNFIRKLYVSNLETKHRNSKIIMTLYTFNLEKLRLQKKYSKNLVYFDLEISKYWKSKLRKRINLFLQKDIDKKNLVYDEYINTENKKDIYIYKYKFLSESMKWYNLYIKLYLSRIIKTFYNEKLKYLRKLELNYKLNKFKFEMFVTKLANMLSKLYNNKIELNLVNLKSIGFNSDIFTDILASRLEKKYAGVDFWMRNILKNVILPETNHVLEKSPNIKTKDSSILENKYKNLNLLSIINSEHIVNNTCSLNKLLKEVTSYTSENDTDKDYTNISDIIFKSIKYKNLGGIRLEVKGRLSKRSRADRSAFTLKWKGGLKDIDSSYKNISTTVYRGFRKPNILYSLSSSKRAVGSFAVKGWISGK